MSFSLQANGSEAVQVTTGDDLVLRVRAYDPAGIRKINIECFQFSTASTNKVKTAMGEVDISVQESFSRSAFDVPVPIPDNAALGKWGVRLIEFTNGRGFKISFYRGQGKFDDIVFEVTPPPSKGDELLHFNGVEIAGGGRRN
ncbi:MAG: hypothetical protein L0229_08060 [Blastocatellia bacterium]|nr:hypothetical protein [Blastocatellia bacterium]